MAAKKIHHRHHKSFTIPVAVIAGFMPPLLGAYDTYKSHNGSLYMTGAYLGKVFTGFDITKNNEWDIGSLFYGAVPVAAGVGVHMLANKLGINRALNQAGIPIFRI